MNNGAYPALTWALSLDRGIAPPFSSRLVFDRWSVETGDRRAVRAGEHRMSSLPAAWSRSLLGGLLSLLVGVGVVVPTPAQADTAPLDPANPATPATVTADPLPTVQINGVAWS